MAATQYFKANKVHRAWLEAWKGKKERKLLGMSGAFFVVMGGYAVDSSNQDAGLVTTISADGFISLLENKIIPTRIQDRRLSKSYFERYTIKDKGNSSNLAKTIVLVQIMWMIVQLIGRLSAGLPVTLLEAHVAIQIPFAAVTYAFWWSKPLDVDELIFLPLDGDAMQGHDVRTETRFKRHGQPFITERTSHHSVIHMLFRVWYDITVYFDWQAELVSASTAVLNAGLHVIVWNSHFPSPTERLLWRLSAIGIGLSPILVYLAIRKKGIEPYALRYFYEARLIGGIPRVAIGQRALLCRTATGNLLWDCITYIDDETVSKINELGGLKGIVISHPHFYTTHLHWAEIFDCPVYLAREDREWVVCPGERQVFWDSGRLSVPGVEGDLVAVKTGGHFPGSSVLWWRSLGVLLVADSIGVVPSGIYHVGRLPGTVSFTFMWSYPNMIPLPPNEVHNIWRAVKDLDFDDIRGGFMGTEVNGNCKQRVLESAQIFVKSMGHFNHAIREEQCP
ncbi:metallo-beta-lactamase family protein [Aspergillus flavus]|nr:uncharacterized protein G4B84_000214 [Aspergillus flavus NRRL3357]QMW24969.1 hypothetical protein G4B84_000214 [Aspergillus flavus NRRL3357]RAQ66860.1 metallo-beta-lactamase family protein [Aspergillus flavus]RAQ68405.1 metallo-beta-lactamase family protein [Aspergillus flavus]